jgi:hypothetical protein
MIHDGQVQNFSNVQRKQLQPEIRLAHALVVDHTSGVPLSSPGTDSERGEISTFASEGIGQR